MISALRIIRAQNRDLRLNLLHRKKKISERVITRSKEIKILLETKLIQCRQIGHKLFKVYNRVTSQTNSKLVVMLGNLRMMKRKLRSKM